MASGSGGGAVSAASSASLARGSTDSTGDPGGRSEQALMVLARRRCWPMCVRFREKLLRFLEPFTLAGFRPGSSFTSNIGCKRRRVGRDHHNFCLRRLSQRPCSVKLLFFFRLEKALQYTDCIQTVYYCCHTIFVVFLFFFNRNQSGKKNVFQKLLTQ